MRKLLVVLVVCLLVVYAGPLLAQASHSVVSKGVLVTLAVNRERLEAGEPLDISVALSNQSGKPVNFEFGNMPIYELWVTTSGGAEVWRYRGELVSGRQELRLQPGETKYYRAMWNQIGGHGRPVEPGWYEVYGRFSASEANVQSLRVRIKIDERLSTAPMVILVPINLGIVNLSTDIGKPVSIEGILRQGPRGLYIDVTSVNVKR